VGATRPGRWVAPPLRLALPPRGDRLSPENLGIGVGPPVFVAALDLLVPEGGRLLLAPAHLDSEALAAKFEESRARFRVLAFTTIAESKGGASSHSAYETRSRSHLAWPLKAGPPGQPIASTACERNRPRCVSVRRHLPQGAAHGQSRPEERACEGGRGRGVRGSRRPLLPETQEPGDRATSTGSHPCPSTRA
jgi:hypothetical protein